MTEDQARRPWSTLAAVVVVLLMVAGVYGFATSSDLDEDVTTLVLVGTSIICFGLLGALVLWRKPGNKMGWVFSAIGLAGVVVGVEIDNPVGLALRIGTWLPFLALAVGVLPLLFPTGEPLTPRWRWGLNGLVVFIISYPLLALLQEQVCVGWAGPEGETCVEWADNPIGVTGVENPEYSTLGTILSTALILMVVASVVSLIIRYRRSDGVERQQIKWLMLSIGVFVTLLLFVDILLGDLLDWRLPDPIIGLIDGLAWLSLPVSCGLAIFRYGLYDIDRVISRTVAYGLVVATLTVAYVAMVTGVGAVVSEFSPSNVDLPMPVIATALVAIAFLPVRQRAIRLADRMVFGRRRTPYEALAGVGGAQLDELLPQIAQLATESTAARAAIVWLSDGTELQPAAIFPENGSPPEPIALDDGRLPAALDLGETLPLTHQESLLGALTIVTGPGEDLPADDRRLLTDLAAHAALTLHGVLESTPLPTGIVTFLMTDIEGSTSLWEDDAETMAVALRTHDATARRIVGDGGGVLVKWRGEGDSTFSVFTNAGQAVLTAMTLQEAIRSHDWGTVRPISIRAALHTGEAELRERDYFGQTVNRCARLRSLAKGGQTLVSAATRELAREGLSPELRFADLGQHQLKDVSEPEQVYEVIATTATYLSTEMPPEPAV